MITDTELEKIANYTDVEREKLKKMSIDMLTSEVSV